MCAFNAVEGDRGNASGPFSRNDHDCELFGQQCGPRVTRCSSFGQEFIITRGNIDRHSGDRTTITERCADGAMMN
jgi:hypothetical protein